jgi:2,4-dienoyl-CoA reductase (NADPH2)
MPAEAVKFLLVNRAEDPESLYEFATRGTKTVTLVEMVDRIGKDIGRTTRWGMLQDLERMGVKIRTATKVLEVTPEGIRVEKGNAVELIPADSVVLAIGAIPFNPLEELLKQMGIPCRVIGDALRIGLAMDAIHQGFKAGRQV